MFAEERGVKVLRNLGQEPKLIDSSRLKSAEEGLSETFSKPANCDEEDLGTSLCSLGGGKREGGGILATLSRFPFPVER